jgi:hypothetical protein
MTKEPKFKLNEQIYNVFENYTGLDVCAATVIAVWTQELAFGKEFFYDIQCAPDGDMPFNLHKIREQDLSTTKFGAWRKLQAHLRGDLASARKRVTELEERLDEVGIAIQNTEFDG